jgi:hypothetical protein
VSPRLLIGLFFAVAAAVAAAGWCIAAGWGWLAALAAYSVAGSAVLVACVSIAALAELRAAARPAKVPATARVAGRDASRENGLLPMPAGTRSAA